jgi:hypothetical protein
MRTLYTRAFLAASALSVLVAVSGAPSGWKSYGG